MAGLAVSAVNAVSTDEHDADESEVHKEIHNRESQFAAGEEQRQRHESQRDVEPLDFQNREYHGLLEVLACQT